MKQIPRDLRRVDAGSRQAQHADAGASDLRLEGDLGVAQRPQPPAALHGVLGRLGDGGIEGGQSFLREELVQQQLVVAIAAARVAAQGPFAGAARQLHQRAIGHEAVHPGRRVGTQQLDQRCAVVAGARLPLIGVRSHQTELRQAEAEPFMVGAQLAVRLGSRTSRFGEPVNSRSINGSSRPP